MPHVKLGAVLGTVGVIVLLVELNLEQEFLVGCRAGFNERLIVPDQFADLRSEDWETSRSATSLGTLRGRSDKGHYESVSKLKFDSRGNHARCGFDVYWTGITSDPNASYAKSGAEGGGRSF